MTVYVDTVRIPAEVPNGNRPASLPRSTLCSWCGHEAHQEQCQRQIQVRPKPALAGPCPCARHHLTRAPR